MRLTFQRHFTKEGHHPYTDIQWVKRSAIINDEKGQPVFEQHDIEVPSGWSQTATNIVASKYFRGKLGTPERENSVRALIDRVVNTITGWADKLGPNHYFETDSDLQIFKDELTHLLVYQKAAFNSPVWFNVGSEEHPQSSACFINSVQDTMESILGLARTEGMLFKHGSGTGSNLSTLRSSKESLGGGGTASGPVSFMRGYDAFAGVIKSGGKCLAPDQRVYTAERGPVPVQELADNGKEFLVLSYDPPAGRFKVKTARAWKSGQKPVVCVKTDKGEFSISVDHPVRLSSDQIIPAGQLIPGMSLLACSIDAPQMYLRVNLRDLNGGREELHRLVARDVMGLDVNGFVVHHIDENPRNNSRENLQVKTQAQHASGHNQELVARGDHIFQKQTFPKVGEVNGMHHDSPFWKDKDRAASYRAKKSDELYKRDTREMQKDASRQKMLNTAYQLINAGHTIDTFEQYVTARKVVLGPPASITQLRQKVSRRFGTYADFLQAVRDGNHRVVSIGIPAVTDVYSVEVDCPTPDDKSSQSGHNFVIWSGSQSTGSGIVVLNTRRAAKMVILNADHPDIVEFVNCKAEEEKKAHALIDAGYDGSFNVHGGAYDSVFFQNANHSVRVTDEFMRAVEEDREWSTKFVKDGQRCETMRARDLMKQIATAAWSCGDPGIQFDTVVNKWHTCPESGRINGSNPCSEYMFLDDTACNLSSLNLMKFVNEEGEFNPKSFQAACRTMITAQEILVDNSSYPTPEIEANSHAFRPLGLGYANLGVLLMDRGLPYDSDAGRAFAAAVTALMHGEAYKQSALISKAIGPFSGYEKNALRMSSVIFKHREHAYDIDSEFVPEDFLVAIQAVWDDAFFIGRDHGYRNSQVTVLAPTGTIGFMMDCDTTGVEPDIALVKYKKLVGGGLIKIVNQSVPKALNRLGYDPLQCEAIVRYIDENEMIEGAPHLKPEHLSIFDCAFSAKEGKRSIHWMGHIKMMSAVQPFLSGAISKTVNMPNSATVDEIQKAYMEGWKLGLKAIAVYRDGCKRSQPLSTSKEVAEQPVAHATRRKLPNERHAITHKFQIAGHEGYITVGMYEDGKPGEIFLVMAKEGSTISGLMDAFATSISMSLQYGVPLETLIEKFSHVRFEPSGFTRNPEIPYAKSLTDYIFRWLSKKFIEEVDDSTPAAPAESKPEPVIKPQSDSPPCHYCGSIMVRNGSCYRCANCGSTSGCS
jgi:ribonucleoside-diphosphate reductase alpha chain